ncbi:DNA-binding SARP family transcriptional activator [Amycolatopsis lexingtonensis]|uniref:DNA-binding SARP family transcriptional activator n=1 Tax=Amycolatopsis lexingtonensis TaxID=218822 RepID=A0ABR9HUP4_9PSEU|nr:BTAD domain-containing putative transcriptional regulator [Amycolatopsis lexingtonensis]MBE1494651.1 DNA-binding SARP family transcriptional activator [Amycolatopsis lexingtonensis]
MEFRVLGAVEATADGAPVDLGSRKQRLVLAVLLLDAGRPVSRDRLVDLLWPTEPPASARGTVQALVSRIRAVFRAAGGPELVTEGHGYVLRAAPDAVDAHRFTALVRRARAADDETAVALLGEALALWRGDALAGAADADVAERLLAGLHEARWSALEDRIDAQLRLGQGRALLAELTELVAAHPLRQRFVGQLMLALHREGRTDAALAAFRGLRARLAAELGLDPAPELARLEAAILAGDPALDAAPEPPPEPVRPAQLPHDVRGFTGRAADLARLDAPAGTGPGPDIRLVTGTAGVGKTALAVRWAHRVRDRFPDGQLYLDLRGFDPDHEPLTPAVAAAHLLRALGTSPRAIPPDPDGRTALWRSLLADRRVLVLLDNARDSAQVTPLLPPSGTVLITSRQRLGDLIARTGARAVPLSVLPADDARQLLETMLGPPAVAAEPAAAAELARLCGHLPLALRLAAANLGAGEASGIAELARELAGGDPLAGLSVDGAEESAVTTAFSVSYRALPAEHRLLFRRLALVPGQTFTAPVAAELAEVAESHAGRLLKALAAAHLVERHLPGRYRFHDLLRSYAASRATADDTAADQDAARRRLFDHYLATADAAGRVLIPHFLRLPRAEPARVFDGTEAALGWLDTEWPNLAAAVEHPDAREYAWHLADALRAFFHHRGHHGEWIDTATTALAAAQAAGARQAQAAMRLSIALAGVNSGRYAEARAHLTTVLHDGLAADWPAGRAAVLNNLSAVHQRLGDPHEAIACGLESLRLCEELAIPGVTMALANVGFACGQVGDLGEALAHFGRALEIAERDGARFSVAVVLVDLGHVHRDLGDPVAASFYERALTANRELGYQYGEAAALSGRAVLEARAGDATRALTDAAEAVELTRRIGDRGTEASALAALGETCLRLDRASEAVSPLSAALEIARETSFTWCEAAALTGLAEAALAVGDAELARTHGEAAAKLAAQSGYRPLETRAAAALGQLAERT